MNKKISVRAVALSGVFIALALVAKQFSTMIYFAGAPGMRIGFSGIFTKLIAIMFGPLVGGISSGITDILGFLIKPLGAYIPLLTVTAVLGGVMTGFLWKYSKALKNAYLKLLSIALLIIVAVLGIINIVYLHLRPNSEWALSLLELDGLKRFFASYGLILLALLGLVFFLLNYLYNRKVGDERTENILLRLLFVGTITGFTVTTLNTFILRMFIPALSNVGFMAFWTTRVIQEIIAVVIQSYILALLLRIYYARFSKE